MRTKFQLVALSMVALCLLSVGMSGCVSTTPATSTTQFTTGTAPPQAVSDLLKRGTAVLLINQNNCPACYEEDPKFADFQTQYKDANVRFATFYVDNNAAASRVAQAYNVTGTPTILVIREDGAFAKLEGAPYPSNGLIDLNAVKSAIDDAQKWRSDNPQATVAKPTLSADYSSYFDKLWESGIAIVDRPFTKSTNMRGNDVYKGMTRNASLPESMKTTTVVELTKSQAEAKQLYDQTVAQKTNEGFTLRPDWVADTKASYPNLIEYWAGGYYGRQFFISYSYDSYVASWLFVTQASG
jgi:thiol-disulfide isomerase/thioredoxin